MKVRKVEDSRRQREGIRGDSSEYVAFSFNNSNHSNKTKRISYRYAPSERALGVHHINKERESFDKDKKQSVTVSTLIFSSES